MSWVAGIYTMGNDDGNTASMAYGVNSSHPVGRRGCALSCYDLRPELLWPELLRSELLRPELLRPERLCSELLQPVS